MSRAFSAAALAQFFSPDADDPFILLVTIAAQNEVPGPNTIRFSNAYTTRLTALELDESMTVYGVVSRTLNFVFLPMEISLPSDEDGAAPRAQIVLHDVTKEAMPLVRSVLSAPLVTIEAVLASAPDSVEMSFAGLTLSSIHYNDSTITATLSADNLALEPFPANTFVPSYFPGLF